MAYVRYLVSDVQKAVDFYSAHLDFTVQQQFGPAMAILKRGDLTLWLAVEGVRHLFIYPLHLL